MSEEFDVGAELAGLRREIFEVRNLVIKTDNLLKNFHLELKDVARRQEVAEKRHFVGHIAGYAAIAVIAITGSVLYGTAVARGSKHEAQALLEQAQKKLADAEAAEQTAHHNIEASDKANAEAMSVWELIVSNDPAKQQQGLDRAAKIDTSKLSSFARAVLDGTAGSMRRSRAEEALNTGMAEYKNNRITAAKTALERFFSLAEGLPPEWKHADRLQAAFHLGAAYNSLGLHTQAIPYLQLYARQGDSPSNKAYAYLLLGDSLEATRQRQEAEKAYRAGLEITSSGYTGSTLRRRLADLPNAEKNAAAIPGAAMPAGAAPAATTATPSAPTPAAVPQG